MLPTQVNYPEFQPDQLLTSEHLNQLFGYLEEQGRLTRTNLIGIGIVCGLEVKTNAAGTAITIAKGCGITSEGYLISVPERTYVSRKKFNAVQERLYDRFVDSDKNQRFEIDELMEAAVENDTTPLQQAYLTDKVVLLFVEILEEGAKNCNPNSCDDKGVEVTVSFKPLIVHKDDAAAIGKAEVSTKTLIGLPVLRMRRYDVEATDLITTSAVFEAYQKLLNEEFVRHTEAVFSETYTALAPLLLDIYDSNPFAGLANKFEFLFNGTINEEKLINFQYYYDLFADLLQAYEELRKVGSEVLASCCPDSNLFPRHLLLDWAMPGAGSMNSEYRQYFIPSPIIQRHVGLSIHLRSLFKRLVLLIAQFYTPPLRQAVRITPSKYGDVALSEKSIPFYYKVLEGEDPLVRYWNYEKTLQQLADKNLSYHADQYNFTDEVILQPLLYDLEPFNFLRIEGHVGRFYKDALRHILSIKQDFRLPFEVIALSANALNLPAQLKGLSRRQAVSDVSVEGRPECHFQDLESLYDALSAELICNLCKEMKYYYDLPGRDKSSEPASTIPQISLLQKCDPNFRFRAFTLGHEFEVFYASIKNQAYIGAHVFFGTALSYRGDVVAANRNDKLDLALLYYIQKLSETITDDLSGFDIALFNTRYHDLLLVASQIKEILKSQNGEGNSFMLVEDILDHLDALIFNCKQAQFQSLYTDYLNRWVQLLMMQKLDVFLQKHPGIQHKAGVTIGGTFILVYHENDVSDVAWADRDFVLVIEDVFSISGRGTVVSGRVERGLINAGDAIEIVDAQGVLIKSVASSVDVARGPSGTMRAGDTIGILLRGVARTDLRRGMLVVNVNNERYSTSETTVFGRKMAVGGWGDYGERLWSNARYRATDSPLQKLTASIEDGVVIADFFLPYLCYSNCPPIHYIIGDGKEPVEDLSISLKNTEYCSADDAWYEIIVSPGGGEISGEGVQYDREEYPVFMPGAVDFAGAEQKVITLTYTKGAQSVSTEVVVYQTPTAAFDIEMGETFNEVSFKNQSNVGSTYKWDFGDGEQSEEEHPSHTYKEEGSYRVTLTVDNGGCRSSQTKEVVIKQEKFDCMPLREVVEMFHKLEAEFGNDRIWEAFKNSFESYGEIESYFKKLEGYIEKPVAEQIQFFVESEIPGRLFGWLERLFKFIVSSDFYRQAAALYNVLLQLALYIMCVQEEDLGHTKVDLSEVFDLVARYLEALKERAKENPESYQPLVDRLIQIFKEALERVNKESKPQYAELLNKFVQILSE